MRKLSGLSGLELQIAYNSLLKLKKTIVFEESEEAADPNALMSSKKRKLSGLSGLELQIACNSLLRLRETITYEESEEAEHPNEPPAEDFEQQVDMMLAQLVSELEGPQV